LTIPRAGAKVIAALSLTLLIPVGAALAQTEPAQSNTTEQKAAPQPSGVQIIRIPVMKVAEDQIPIRPQPEAEKQMQLAVQPAPNLQSAVIPPAPSVVKRSPDAISIPLDTAEPEPRYEEQAVTSTNVRVGSMYGYRRDPFTRRAKFHSGVDLKAKWGDPIGASAPGVVQYVGWYHGYGNWVIVDHGGGVTTHYAHLSSFDVFVGDRVERGTIVGRAGSTGRATSPHLHYEVRIDGNPVNPFQTIALDPSSDYFKRMPPPAEVKSDAPQPERPPLPN
jgi:murein DD-endopeptidase MepM/ murein hydrolase activator NlpD